MDGAKHNTDTLEAFSKKVLVSRRAFCTEVSSREGMEQKAMRILAIVGCDFAENAKCRKSKVFLTLYVSQELVSS